MGTRRGVDEAAQYALERPARCVRRLPRRGKATVRAGRGAGEALLQVGDETARRARVAKPMGRIVAPSGDCDFRFMIEARAVGAQFKLPCIHMVANNSCLATRRADAPTAIGLLD